MPGQAVAQTLKYAEIVDVDLDATNDVNFADVEDYGHRVMVEMPKAALNDFLHWQRASGAARPSAKISGAPAFQAALADALNVNYVDVDGVTGGLHFGTENMNLNPDARLRADGVSANDIPLAFILYKLYGSSSVATLDNIYNLADAHGMLSSETVAEAIVAGFQGAEAGAVDQMFRDLLAADPHRFFDSTGMPIAGIFESNADAAGEGSWLFTENDVVEIKLKLAFHSKITRRGVAGREHLLASADSAASQENQQTIISPDDYFYIRLQLKAVTGSGSSDGSSSGPGPSIPAGSSAVTVEITAIDSTDVLDLTAYRANVGKTVKFIYDTQNKNVLQVLFPKGLYASGGFADLSTNANTLTVEYGNMTSELTLKSPTGKAFKTFFYSNSAAILGNAVNSTVGMKLNFEDVPAGVFGALYTNVKIVSRQTA